MMITVELPPEVESKIKTQASNDGLKVEDYIKSLIKEASEKRERAEKLKGKPLAEVLAPIQQDFTESGMTEVELADFFDDLREKVWREKQNAAE